MFVLCAAGQLAPAWHSLLKLLDSLEELMPHLVKASKPLILLSLLSLLHCQLASPFDGSLLLLLT